MVTRVIPSFFSSLFRVHTSESTNTIIGAISAIKRSKYDDMRNGRGAINADTPRMSRIFTIFDPTTFPIAISGFPRRAASIEVIISGALVPIAIMVNQIMLSESHAIFARSTAPVTSIFPQRNRTHTPHSTHIPAFQGERTFSTVSSSSGTMLL